MLGPATAVSEIIKLIRLTAECFAAVSTLLSGLGLAWRAAITRRRDLDLARVALPVAVKASSTPLALGHT